MARRVLFGQVMHETNTFSKQLTTLDSYKARYLLRGAEIPKTLAGTESEPAGFMDVADREGWEMVYSIAGNATPAGKLTKECWETIAGEMVAAARDKGPFDGVLLALHGAMVTEVSEDGEGDLLQRLRGVLGPDVPILVTLDLHANVTDLMAAHANGLLAYRTYPHVDQREQGNQAAEWLRDAMEAKKVPHCLVRRRPTLMGVDHGRTTMPGPMVDALEKAKVFEKEDGILRVSVHAGFFKADIADAGPSVAVTHLDKADRAAEIAESLMDFVWETRADTAITYLTPQEAAKRAKAHDGVGGPIVIADTADNPGGGGYSDSTMLLKNLLEVGLQDSAFGAILDTEVVAAARAAGVGNTITVKLGGKVDATVSPPIEVTGEVRNLSDGAFTFDGPMWKGQSASMGSTAVLRVGGLDILVISNRMQVLERQMFISQGIDPSTCNVVVVKSSQHFRAAFAPIAKEVLVANGDGLTSPDPAQFTYVNLRRPIWPLDTVD